MSVTWSPLREQSVMNQFQALCERFLTTDGVPALTFCNEVRSPYPPLGWGVEGGGWRGFSSAEGECEWMNRLKYGPTVLGQICYTKGNRRDEMRGGWSSEDDRVRPPRLSHKWSARQRIVHISPCAICWVYCVFMLLVSSLWLSEAADAAALLVPAARLSICSAALSKMSLPWIRRILIHTLSRPSAPNGSF